MQPLGRLVALLILMALSACSNPERFMRGSQAYADARILQISCNLQYFCPQVDHMALGPQPGPNLARHNRPIPAEVLNLFRAKDVVGFMALQQGVVRQEFYADGLDADSYFNPFSVTKTLTALLLARAVTLGEIESLEQQIGTYLPDMPAHIASLRLIDVLRMETGLAYREGALLPGTDLTRLVFSGDTSAAVADTLPDEAARQGEVSFRYSSLDTQILSLLLQAVYGEKFQAFVTQEFWQPLDMRDAGFWALDHRESAQVLGFCCLSMTAESFARIGLFLAAGGKTADGQQLIDPRLMDTLMGINITTGAPTSVHEVQFFNEREFYGSHVFLERRSLNGRDPERWSIQARGLGKIIQVFPHDGVVMVVIRSRAGGADELDQQILDAYAAGGVPLGDYID